MNLNSYTDNKQTIIPENWILIKLGNCVEVLDSKRIPVNTDEREKRNQGKSPSELFPYYGATGQVGLIDGYLFDEELVLLGEDGAPFYEPTKHKAYMIKGKSWANNHAHVLKAIEGLTLNSFVCNYLNTFDYHGYVTGTTRHKLNQAPMRKIPIPLPPLTEQHRIVAKIEELFTKLDAGVEALKKIKTELKRYRQSVLKSAFEGKLTEEWREKNKDKLELASVLLEKIKEERKKKLDKKYKELLLVNTAILPKLPVSWLWFRLEYLFDWLNGKGLTKKSMKFGDYLVYGGNGITGMHNEWLSDKEAIVIGRVGAHCGNVNLAKPKSWITDNAIYSSWYSEYIYLKFYAYFLADMKLNRLSGGSGQPYVSQIILNSLTVTLLPISEQYKIVEEIERRFSVADAIEKTVEQSLKQAERLRQSILKIAFEGKLVKQDPTDEPAEKLLARTKAKKEKQISERPSIKERFPKSPKSNRASTKGVRIKYVK